MMLTLKYMSCLQTVRRIRVYLSFCQHEGSRHFESLRSWQVLVQLELMLQFQQLLARKGSSWSPALAEQVGLRLGCRYNNRSENINTVFSESGDAFSCVRVRVWTCVCVFAPARARVSVRSKQRDSVRKDISIEQLFAAPFWTNLLKRTETERQYLVGK